MQLLIVTIAVVASVSAAPLDDLKRDLELARRSWLSHAIHHVAHEIDHAAHHVAHEVNHAVDHVVDDVKDVAHKVEDNLKDIAAAAITAELVKLGAAAAAGKRDIPQDLLHKVDFACTNLCICHPYHPMCMVQLSKRAVDEQLKDVLPQQDLEDLVHTVEAVLNEVNHVFNPAGATRRDLDLARRSWLSHALHKVGHAIHDAAHDIGHAVDHVAHDIGHTVDQVAHDIRGRDLDLARRSWLSHALHKVSHAIHDVAHDIGHGVDNVAHDIGHTVHQVGHDIKDGYDHVTQDIGNTVDKVGQDIGVDNLSHKAEDVAKVAAVAKLLGALAAGK